MLSAAIRSKPKRKNADKPLLEGLSWLLEQIGEQYDTLKNRVCADMDDQRQEREEAMQERMERVRIRRRERWVLVESWFNEVQH